MTPFSRRHIGPSEAEKKAMLAAIGIDSISTLIDRTIPAQIRLDGELKIADAMTEQEYLQHVSELAAKNQVFKSFIGLGYHETIVPSVILRNVLENPGWYTAYTPYQAEISQGRLEALLNFQTMVLDLTGMEIANASLLDEGTAASEAMIMFYNSRSRADVQAGKNKFFVAEDALPQSIDVMLGRAINLGIELVTGNIDAFEGTAEYFGAFIQNPSAQGHVRDLTAKIAQLKGHGIQVAVAADILSMVVLKSPGSMGADVVLGSSQRFGVPMGYGGPHAAFFAAKEEYKRNIPGRIIGVSKDADDNFALRMALQTREQHIKRDKATSNICTAQALLSVMASMYAVYHGPDGIRAIASHVHDLATKTAAGLAAKGITLGSDSYFDTLWIKGVDCTSVRAKAEAQKLNFRYISDSELSISFGEPHTMEDVSSILACFDAQVAEGTSKLSSDLKRTDAVLSHPVFNSHHSESQMMRYLKRLENKDL